MSKNEFERERGREGGRELCTFVKMASLSSSTSSIFLPRPKTVTRMTTRHTVSMVLFVSSFSGVYHKGRSQFGLTQTPAHVENPSEELEWTIS